MEGTIYALRGILLILAVIISFVKIRISPSTEIVPTLNSCAGLMGFFFFKVWTWIVERFGAAPWASQGKEMQCFRPAFSLPTKPHLAIRNILIPAFSIQQYGRVRELSLRSERTGRGPIRRPRHTRVHEPVPVVDGWVSPAHLLPWHIVDDPTHEDYDRRPWTQFS
ncbi:uncharacterized protein LOC116202339 [Punica granatum]|uniref:Uncharacterized protein LOC116202339 n=1 Tax=Punica granatum TaxID=22663 RepID=A0A6P8D880_PUNGR|nr:uncharacterized protein LOC116202339 [Punica granatum]